MVLLLHHATTAVSILLLITVSACSALSTVSNRKAPSAFTQSSHIDTTPKHVDVSFSHIHLYVDRVQDVSIYKDLENKLNKFSKQAAKEQLIREKKDYVTAARDLYRRISGTTLLPNQDFESHNRDVVQQLVAGLGFRVTGQRTECSNTRSVLVTSPDPAGVQMIVTSENNNDAGPTREDDEYKHFDAANLKRFFGAHENRQGIAVLGFEVSSVDDLYQRYLAKHPDLILNRNSYAEAKVLECFAYYKDDGVDEGTVLRFVEPLLENAGPCILPGLIPVEATFDDSSRPAYCDHWVSNVKSRTSFLSTLEDVLGFTPKVDFNAGIVAAGEAQIESTVTGNTVERVSTPVLKNQQQVYLPINNALSEVGHVHGFLQEIGQGVQHVASRVDNLVEFVQRANDYRTITGEGFTFLRIPRSYYGVLTQKQLLETCRCLDDGSSISETCAEALLEACRDCKIVSEDDNSANLEMGREEMIELLDSTLPASFLAEFHKYEPQVLDCILRSRYSNLYSLLGDQLDEEQYLGIVRNQILVDVQGQDLLFQIFTSNILQRQSGQEAPFFEFIQRVCSAESLKPGCGGFGIRNFLTLFLSIEVSKAMTEASRAKACGDEEGYAYAQQMVDCFTDQLTESNPILTEISDAMTKEGECRDRIQSFPDDEPQVEIWRKQEKDAAAAKAAGNEKLMECSTKYKLRMRSIREQRQERTT